MDHSLRDAFVDVLDRNIVSSPKEVTDVLVSILSAHVVAENIKAADVLLQLSNSIDALRSFSAKDQ
jgi:hypothetical protein